MVTPGFWMKQSFLPAGFIYIHNDKVWSRSLSYTTVSVQINSKLSCALLTEVIFLSGDLLWVGTHYIIIQALVANFLPFTRKYQNLLYA